MTRRIAAIVAMLIGVVALWPLLFGIEVMLTRPVDRITGGDWGFLGLYLLCAIIGGALIATAIWIFRSEQRR